MFVFKYGAWLQGDPTLSPRWAVLAPYTASAPPVALDLTPLDDVWVELAVLDSVRLLFYHFVDGQDAPPVQVRPQLLYCWLWTGLTQTMKNRIIPSSSAAGARLRSRKEGACSARRRIFARHRCRSTAAGGRNSALASCIAASPMRFCCI